MQKRPIFKTIISLLFFPPYGSEQNMQTSLDSMPIRSFLNQKIHVQNNHPANDVNFYQNVDNTVLFTRKQMHFETSRILEHEPL